jgi:molybdenum cofactor biosynthesis enzyme MoaA
MRVKNPFRALFRILFLKAPIEAQLIVTRRCNLSCGYCTEYDNFSEPIPFEILKERIEALHRLRVSNIALLGGEPLLHPKIGEVVAHANRQAQVSMTTNGFLLSDKLIERLNEAGLSNMQVSIDSLHPDTSGYIQKSMKSIVPKLERLQRLAKFDVHVNIVLCEDSKEHFKTTLHELRRFGFFVSVNLIHDSRGMIEISGPEYLELWEHHFQKGSPFSFIEYEYGKQLLQGRQPEWKCRAGARFLYVDEFGNTQFCSAQRGRLNKPITQYGRDDLRRHADTYKGCEEGCSIFCVYRDSQMDNAPLQVAKAMHQALRRGVLFRSNHNGFVPLDRVTIKGKMAPEMEPV